MPLLTFSTALAANGQAQPIAGWQYEYLPWPAAVKYLARATAVGVQETIYSGSETIKEASPVPSGGTAGQTPSEFQVHPIEWVAGAGDRLKILLRDSTGGAQTIDGIIMVDPLV